MISSLFPPQHFPLVLSHRSLSLTKSHLIQLPFFTMKGGKRVRTLSSSPTVEHVVWQEKKTGRGSKVIPKTISSPATPKAKRQPNPSSKRRKLEVTPIIVKHAASEETPSIEPIQIKLPQPKKKSGKVLYLSIAQRKAKLKVIFQSQHEMLSELLLSRDQYISEILDQEQPPASMVCPRCQSTEGLFRCKDCFFKSLLCWDCCHMVHREVPFHSIEKWTGYFFQSTSLYEEGFTLYLGHGGELCPKSCIQEGRDGVTPNKAMGEETPLESGQHDTRKHLVVVDVSGVHQLRIGWCQCKDAPKADIQLLRSQLFPATIINPSTAFTFRLLSYFHIDSVECKTSALSFFSKLRRLTNPSDPDSVPVCCLCLHHFMDASNYHYRTDIGNS